LNSAFNRKDTRCPTCRAAVPGVVGKIGAARKKIEEERKEEEERQYVRRTINVSLISHKTTTKQQIKNK